MRPFGICALSIVASSSVAAQPATPRTARSPRYLTRLLELDHERARAANELLRIGVPAVEPLVRALRDPRPEIAHRVMAVLMALGADAKPAVATLREQANDADSGVASAARIALARIDLEGGMVVAHYSGNCVVLYDANRKEVGKIAGIKGPWSVQRIAKERYLVAEVLANKVRVVDGKGKEHWAHDINRPYGAQRLLNGNTLIASFGTKKVVEIDPAGKVVWSFDKGVTPIEADRLPNGNTLVSDYNGNRVIEVTAAGEIVWTAKAQSPYSAERLRNGNTLISLSSTRKVIEVDGAGREVAEIAASATPVATHTLANGTILLSTQGALRGLDPSRKELWSIKLTQYVGSVVPR